MTSTETVQIFFPKSQINKRGYLVGNSTQIKINRILINRIISFNVSGTQTTVIFIEENSELDQLENILNGSKRFANLINYCGSKLVVLGRIHEKGDQISEYCKQQIEMYDIWIDIEYSKSRKQQYDQFKIKTQLCYSNYCQTSQLIFYEDIKKNSLLSINPNKVRHAYSSFDIPHEFIQNYYDHRNKSDNDIQLAEYFSSHIDVCDFDVNLKQMEIMNNDIFNNKYHQNLPELEYTIKQINFSNLIQIIYQDEILEGKGNNTEFNQEQEQQQINDDLNQNNNNNNKNGDTSQNQQDKSNNEKRNKEESDRRQGNVYERWLKPVWCSAVQKLFYSLVYGILDFRFPLINRSLVQMKVGRNVFNQVKFKLEVMQSWPILLGILKHKHQSLKYSFVLKIYLRLLSGLTYIAIDTILGLLSIIFIAFNVSTILEHIHQYFSGIHIDALSKEVEWLMSDPAGLKTNKNLNKVMGFLISNIFIFWNYFTTFATPFEPYLMRLIAFFGFFGISFEMCIVNDIINILTLHVYLVYRMLLLIYREVIQLIKILYGVMNGKESKGNNSTDELTWEKKVLSLIFFFFLISMFPTIAMYYFAYLLIVLAVYIIKVSLNTSVHILNTFPAFVLFQYFTNKDLFPKLCLVTLKKYKDLSDMAIFNLETRQMPMAYLLGDFNSKISKFFKMVNVSKILRFSFIGNDILIAVENKTQRRKHSFSSGNIGTKSQFSLQEIEKDIALLSEM